MDVWEHAFLLDYKPAERPKYIEAFFANIDWRPWKTVCKAISRRHKSKQNILRNDQWPGARNWLASQEFPDDKARMV